jgi:hypothetical protein
MVYVCVTQNDRINLADRKWKRIVIALFILRAALNQAAFEQNRMKFGSQQVQGTRDLPRSTKKL